MGRLAVTGLRWLFSRGTKIYGNSTKLVSWALYLLNPHLRFSIPHTSGPLLARPQKHKIPKIIWQTNYTDRVTIAVYFNYLCNRWLSPTYSYRFMDTAERARFINEQFPGRIAGAYAKLQIGAAQADLWRLLVLYRFGGVYLDIDAHAAWPLGLAIDPDLDELYVLHRGGKLSNYFIASVQENPNLALVIDAVLENIDRPTTTNIFELTGPAVLHDALESVREHQVGLQSFRSMRRIDARRKNASALRLRFSQSLASLRHRLSQAMVRSTTQRRGNTTNPLA
jgi:mannosyltransferase OCH1-like enzyme